MEKSRLPISPADLPGPKQATVPDEVIECFDRAIRAKWNRDLQVAFVSLGDVHPYMCAAHKHTVRRICDIYRQRGWVVTYNDGAFCAATVTGWTFKPARGR